MTDSAAAKLAQTYDARTLGNALIARLTLDGRVDVASAVLRTLGEAADIIDPGPPNPGGKQ